jgi:hypothetical protein
VTLHVIGERVHLAHGLSFSLQRSGYTKPPVSARRVNLGALPVHRVLDYSGSFPVEWRAENAVFVPLLNNETIWLGFACPANRPHAVQAAVGNVNAITGSEWVPSLDTAPQNYLVVPDQARWSGIYSKGKFLPFSAASLRNADGSERDWILSMYECRPECVKPVVSKARHPGLQPLHDPELNASEQVAPVVVPDDYGLQCWRQPAAHTVRIHTVTVADYQAITGLTPPPDRSSSEVFMGRRLP